MEMNTTSLTEEYFDEAKKLADADLYKAPEKHCDIVLKGGITSGIVYPLAVCGLAQVYSFKSIGGTSVGAIAAAAIAAAEHGRSRGGRAAGV